LVPGKIPFKILSQVKPKIILVSEGQICSTIIDLHKNLAIIAEPVGVLSIVAVALISHERLILQLDQMKESIRGKNVVCVIGGSNTDITLITHISILS